MNAVFLFIAFLGISAGINADASVFIDRGFLIIDSSGRALRDFKEVAVIDHVSGETFEAYGNIDLQQKLERSSYIYGVLEKINKSAAVNYPSPEQINSTLHSIANNCRGLMNLQTIGQSVQGRPLVVARITSGVGSHKPEFKYIANMHGDEIAGREFMVWLLQDLCAQYGTRTPIGLRITHLLDTIDVYIMPSMNPDGAAMHQRANASGSDLNRSFPDFTTEDSQDDSLNRPVEVQAVMNFESQHHFKLSANFHGGAEVVNYPWDTEANIFPQHDFIKDLSLKYAQSVPYIFASRVFPQGITNGYAWYEVDGGMQDWSYYYRNDLQVTIELTQMKWPAYETLRPAYQQNFEALIRYMEGALEF